MAKTKTELRELETVEVSLVDKGANQRVFAIKKSELEEMNVINAILSAPFEKEAELVEALTKAELSKQAVEGVKSAIQILSAFQEEVPEDLMKELMRLGGLSKQEDEEEEKPDEVEKPEGEGEEEESEEEEVAKPEHDDDEEEEDMKKRLSKMPKDVRSMVETLWKTNKSALAQAKEFRAQIKKSQDVQRLAECVVVAKEEYSSLPVKTEDLGAFIKTLDGSKNAAFVLDLLKSTNELISNGGLTSEIGKSTTTHNELSTIAKAERMAEAMVNKEGITKERAMANVFKSNPSLYVQYQQEKGS